MQILAEATVQITFVGETFLYRTLFDDAGVLGKYVDVDGEECDKEGAACYARGLPRADLKKQEHLAFIMKVLNSFQQTSMRVTIHESLENDDEIHVTALKEMIRECSWVFTFP